MRCYRFLFVVTFLAELHLAGLSGLCAPPIDSQTYRYGGLAPEEAQLKFHVSDNLQIEQLLTEPDVAQPVFLNFDERGRMWVVQYRQYPHPAGLKIVSRDNYWRNVYDRIPQPPPHHDSGRDRITIHEDTDGDGKYDSTQVFLDGLNMVTAVERGRGGIWVLNPPYLLFYPDRDQDDVPDADPRVILSGFGLEDSHSLVNSLRWGPDGWLYGAQGSTVTGNVVGPLGGSPVYSQGQLVWRYHPELQIYEVFAEGGGNAFGLELNAHGEIFSGHNGGDTRGFHYVQGGYYQKGFSKHGPLSNPFAFGYFPAMQHHRVERFTHNFIVYEADQLPLRYHGALLGIEPLQGRVVMAEMSRLGSTYQTRDLQYCVQSDDDWFRPVDIKAGPDGAVYIADWYDGQVNHYYNHEGQIDPTNGRIYRLSSRSAETVPWGEDLSLSSSSHLVDRLTDSNKWVRQTVLRILGDRRDRSVVPLLTERLRESRGQLAVEQLWALNLSGGLDRSAALDALSHAEPWVRAWTVRLQCDDRKVEPELAQALTRLAATEKTLIVRNQLACSARRLPPADGWPIVRELLAVDDDQDDPFQPLLLWWALEAFASKDPDFVVERLRDPSVWDAPVFQADLTERLMQRFAQTDEHSDLLRCARLLELAPGPMHLQRLVNGFQSAFEGRSVGTLPRELAQRLAAAGADDLAWRLQLGEPDAQSEALRQVVDRTVAEKKRAELARLLGEMHVEGSLPALLELIVESESPEVLMASIGALAFFDDPRVPELLLERFSEWPSEIQQRVQTTLASRPAWAKRLIDSATSGSIDPLSLTLETLRRCLELGDSQLAQQIRQQWGDVQREDTEAAEERIGELAETINQQLGDPYSGHQVFKQNCGVCHRLFEEGGDVGPDLTVFDRTDLSKMLLSVVLPSAEIREGFESYVVILDDGRVVNGILHDQDPTQLTFRTSENESLVVARSTIDQMQLQTRSLMPSGILDKLDEPQLRDLFAYLRSTQPLNE